jgi:translocation and assembly module TamA
MQPPARKKDGKQAGEVCEGYRIESKETITFNANEKKLICGDPEAGAWKDIPQFEAEYFIGVFLQDRGYFFPTYTKDGDTVVVHPGEQAKISHIEVQGSPPDFFDITRRRKIVGQVLTPAILNTLKDWIVTVLKTNGYACPMVNIKAYPQTGEVIATIEPGEFQTIAEVIEEPVQGLRPGMLARYRAFRIGDPYNMQNLNLTSSRITTIDGILQSSYFTTECTAGGAVLTQKSLAGPKRLVNIGIGASTEDYLIGKLRFKWTRMDSKGSSIELSARGSYRKQWINAAGYLYPLSEPSRWYLYPFATTRRYSEKQYEYMMIATGFPAAVTWETQDVGFNLQFGPGYTFVSTYKGAARGYTHFVLGSLRLNISSHDYFYRVEDPQQGFTMGLRADFAHDKVGSSVTAQRFGFSGQALWNIAGFEPPLFILAARWIANVTLTNTGSTSFPRLPPPFFTYFGGSTSLRGFSRRQLPVANRGALTGIYIGGEARLANVLPLNIQPLVFFDIGAMGQRSMDLDYPVYASPGFGMRWPSFVGVFRVTLGHGFLINNKNPANNNLEHWQFFFSYGEEF